MNFLRLLVLLTFGYSQAVLISKLPLPGAYDDTIIGQGKATFLTKAEAARVRREQASGTLRTSYTTDKLPPDDDPHNKNEPGFYGPIRNEFRETDRNRGGERNDYRGSDRNENGSGYRQDNSGERNFGGGNRNGYRDRNENMGNRNDYRGDRNDYRGDRNDNRGDRNDNRGDRNDFRGDRNDYRGEDRDRFVGDRNDFRDNRFEGPDRRYNERDGNNRDRYQGNRDEYRGSRPNDYQGDRRGDPRNNYGSNEISYENPRDYYPTHDPRTNERKYEECGRRCGPNSNNNGNSNSDEDRPPRDNPPRVIFIQPRPLQRPRPDGYQGAVLRGGPRPGYQGNGPRRGPPNEAPESEPPFRNLPPNGPGRDRFRGDGPPPNWEPRNQGFRGNDGGGSGEDSSWEGRRNNVFPRASGLIPVYDTPLGSFEQDRFPDESSGSRRRQSGPGSIRDGSRSRDCMDEEGRRDMSRPGCALRWKMEPEEALTGEGTVGFYGTARRE